MRMRKSAMQRATESCTIATRVEQETQLLPGRERRDEGKEERESSSRGWICWAYVLSLAMGETGREVRVQCRNFERLLARLGKSIGRG